MFKTTYRNKLNNTIEISSEKLEELIHISIYKNGEMEGYFCFPENEIELHLKTRELINSYSDNVFIEEKSTFLEDSKLLSSGNENAQSD